MSPEIQTMALERQPAEAIRDVAVAQGMTRLRDDGLQKVRQGRTSIAEIARVVGTTESESARLVARPATTSSAPMRPAPIPRANGHEPIGRCAHHGHRFRRPADGGRQPPASDLHLSSGAHPTVRVRGQLAPLEEYPKLSSTDTREIIYSILTGDQRQRLETDWQLDFAYSIPGHARFRVNAYYQRGAIGAAFRLIPFGLTSIDELGLPPAVHEFTRRPRGFVLVTGPTGSGKSTSLAAMIDEINPTREEHIMTIEDPIEFLHGHKKCIVNQRELGSDAQSFARRAEGRPAPGPRRDPRRRDARPGDDLHGADRRRDRPPRVRHAAHAGRRADDRPHHRRVPRPPAGPGARAAVGRAAGDHDPAAAAQRRRLRPRRRVRGARAQPRGSQPDPRGQDPPDLLGPADRLGRGHADDGHRAGDARAPGQDHPEARRSALVHARGARAGCSAPPRWRPRRRCA